MGSKSLRYESVDVCIQYIHFQSFSRFLGQRFDSEIIFEKLQISLIFKAFPKVVSRESINPKNRENDRGSAPHLLGQIHQKIREFFVVVAPVDSVGKASALSTYP